MYKILFVHRLQTKGNLLQSILAKLFAQKSVVSVFLYYLRLTFEVHVVQNHKHMLAFVVLEFIYVMASDDLRATKEAKQARFVNNTLPDAWLALDKLDMFKCIIRTVRLPLNLENCPVSSFAKFLYDFVVLRWALSSDLD